MQKHQGPGQRQNTSKRRDWISNYLSIIARNLRDVKPFLKFERILHTLNTISFDFSVIL